MSHRSQEEKLMSDSDTETAVQCDRLINAIVLVPVMWFNVALAVLFPLLLIAGAVGFLLRLLHVF